MGTPQSKAIRFVSLFNNTQKVAHTLFHLGQILHCRIKAQMGHRIIDVKDFRLLLPERLAKQSVFVPVANQVLLETQLPKKRLGDQKVGGQKMMIGLLLSRPHRTHLPMYPHLPTQKRSEERRVGKEG